MLARPRATEPRERSTAAAPSVTIRCLIAMSANKLARSRAPNDVAPNRASARRPRPRAQIFSIAPEAKGLFPFSRGRQSDEDLYNNLYLKKHGANVVMTVNTAVEGLTDLDALVPVLKGLGKRHVGYGARRPRP